MINFCSVVSRHLQISLLCSSATLQMLTVYGAHAESYYPSDAFSLTKEQSDHGLTYADLVNTTASYSWHRTCLNEQLSADIPYSPLWRVNRQVLKPLYREVVAIDDREISVFSFGPFISAGTYMTSQFRLSTSLTDNPATLTVMLDRARGQCPSGEAPTIETVGDVKGIASLQGGAKGCATAFDFVKGGWEIQATSFGGMEFDRLDHSLSPDLRRIISSISVTPDCALEQ